METEHAASPPRLRDLTSELIAQRIEELGSKEAAAKSLGVSLKTIYNRLAGTRKKPRFKMPRKTGPAKNRKIRVRITLSFTAEQAAVYTKAVRGSKLSQNKFVQQAVLAALTS